MVGQDIANVQMGVRFSLAAQKSKYTGLTCGIPQVSPVYLKLYAIKY